MDDEDEDISDAELLTRLPQTLWIIDQLQSSTGLYDGDASADAILLRSLIEEAPSKKGKRNICEDIFEVLEKNNGDLSSLKELADYWENSLILPSTILTLFS